MFTDLENEWATSRPNEPNSPGWIDASCILVQGLVPEADKDAIVHAPNITVTTRDGLPGTMRGFIGDYRGSKANVSRRRFVVNREIRAYPRPAVCGGLDRGDRVIENHCVMIS